jgi:uncharacterized membrane protein YhhN
MSETLKGIGIALIGLMGLSVSLGALLLNRFPLWTNVTLVVPVACFVTMFAVGVLTASPSFREDYT